MASLLKIGSSAGWQKEATKTSINYSTNHSFSGLSHTTRAGNTDVGFCRENIRPGAASKPVNVLFCAVMETKSLMNYALRPNDALTRRDITANRTIPLVFTLLRPHCCVVRSSTESPAD